MNNPLTDHKTNGFMKRFIFFFITWLLIAVEECKTGSLGEARKLPTYYKPTPNSWQFVYEHLPSIIVFSLCAGLVFAIVMTPFFREK